MAGKLPVKRPVRRLRAGAYGTHVTLDSVGVESEGSVAARGADTSNEIDERIANVWRGEIVVVGYGDPARKTDSKVLHSEAGDRPAHDRVIG